MRLHPAAQIIVWCLLVAGLQALSPGALLSVSGLVLLGASVMSGHKLVLLVRRTRWVMFSLLLIYAYSTPGQPLFELLGLFSPTREGLADGVLQLVRLLAALAGLAILLERLHRQQLIAGLYTLFAPVQWLGMSRERLAVRLALTLHYAEVAMLRGTSDWQATLNGLLDPHDEQVRQMELSLYRFGISDAALLFAAITVVWMLWR